VLSTAALSVFSIFSGKWSDILEGIKLRYEEDVTIYTPKNSGVSVAVSQEPQCVSALAHYPRDDDVNNLEGVYHEGCPPPLG